MAKNEDLDVLRRSSRAITRNSSSSRRRRQYKNANTVARSARSNCAPSMASRRGQRGSTHAYNLKEVRVGPARATGGDRGEDRASSRLPRQRLRRARRKRGDRGDELLRVLVLRALEDG